MADTGADPPPAAPTAAAATGITTTTSSSAPLLLARGGPPRTTRELALHNYRLGFFNLVANWANLHRTKYLEGAVVAGRAEIDVLSTRVEQQNSELDELNQGLEHVSGALRAQRAQMGTALDEFSEQVSRQNAAIARQQRAMEQMLASKFQSDAVVDTSIAAVSGWLSSTPVISLPVYLVTMWLPRKARWVATTLLRLAAFFKMAHTMRCAAMDRGMHNAVGTPSAYIATAIAYVTKKTKEKMAAKREDGGGERNLAGEKAVAIDKIKRDEN